MQFQYFYAIEAILYSVLFCHLFAVNLINFKPKIFRNCQILFQTHRNALFVLKRRILFVYPICFIVCRYSLIAAVSVYETLFPLQRKKLFSMHSERHLIVDSGTGSDDIYGNNSSSVFRANRYTFAFWCFRLFLNT